jgi:hypothetical protein
MFISSFRAAASSQSMMRPFPFKKLLWISVMNEAEVIERDRYVT